LNLSRRIVVIGASGHAKVLIDIVEQQGPLRIVGLIDSFKQPGTRVTGYDVIGRENSIAELIATEEIIGGISPIGRTWVPCRIAKGIRELASDFAFVKAIRPARIAREVTLGHSVAVTPGQVRPNFWV
jgi:hypothetical protein